MTAKILHFKDWRNKMRKKLNPESHERELDEVDTPTTNEANNE